MDGIHKKIKYHPPTTTINGYVYLCFTMMTNVSTDSTMTRTTTTTTESTSVNDLSAFISSLPIICLQTANFNLTIQDVIHGKNTIIDLWTTRCTRCPAALDRLNEFAIEQSNTSNDVQCISICCGDTIDHTREILESSKVPKWNSIQHYFMEYRNKEQLKSMLQFKQVPYYIAFSANGTMIYASNTKVDDWCTLFIKNNNFLNNIGHNQRPQQNVQKLTIEQQATTSTPTHIKTIIPFTDLSPKVMLISPTSTLSVPKTSSVEVAITAASATATNDFTDLIIDDMDF